MSNAAQARLRALAVAAAPVALLAGFLTRPYLSNPRDPAVNAEAVVAGLTRWISAHLVLATGLVLTVLSILAIRFWLSSLGEDLWSFVSVAFVAIGATGLVFVVGYDGLGGWAVADSGGDAEAFFESAQRLETPIFAISAVILGLGLFALAGAVVRARALGRMATWAVVIGVLVTVAAPSIPVGWAVYVQSVAAGLASWPIAWRIWRSAPPEG